MPEGGHSNDFPFLQLGNKNLLSLQHPLCYFAPLPTQRTLGPPTGWLEKQVVSYGEPTYTNETTDANPSLLTSFSGQGGSANLWPALMETFLAHRGYS